MKFVSIALPMLLVIMFQSSLASPNDREVDIAAEIEDVQALIQNLESNSDTMDVNAQIVGGGQIFQLQLLLRDLIRAIGNLSRSMTRKCACEQTS